MKVKRVILLMVVLLMAFVLTGCAHDIVDGHTGVRVHRGVVSDKYLAPGRVHIPFFSRDTIYQIDNRVQTFTSNEVIEGQSKDNVIIMASGFGFSYRIGSGEKSVWLLKNISDIENPIPASVVENALKDALLEVDAINVTKRTYVNPIFKNILQARLDEHFNYHNGEDTSLVTITSVTCGNLKPEAEYDKELSRAATLKLRKENDAVENQLKIENVKAQIELAEHEAQLKTAGWDEIKKKISPEILAYLLVEKVSADANPTREIMAIVDQYLAQNQNIMK